MPNNKLNPRREAAKLLHRILREGAFSNRVLDSTLKAQPWDERGRKLLTELLYGTLRHLYQIDRAIDLSTKKGIKSIKKSLLNHLRIATYQILFLERVPDYAAISEAIEIIKQQYGKRVGGFANAILQNIKRNREKYLSPPTDLPKWEALSAEYNYPTWLIKLWSERWGENQTIQRLKKLNTPAPLILRAHPNSESRERAIEKLKEMGISAEPTRWSHLGIKILSPLPKPLNAFLKEFPIPLFPQDEAAQIVVNWLDPKDEEEILDACAAPGGKTTQISILAPKSKITASDIHPKKLRLIEELFKRLNRPASPPHLTLLPADAASFQYPKQYDKILCDAPCSSLGIIRKQPEVRYRRTLREIHNLSELQFSILENLIKYLKPGGTLLYSVCTDTPEENELLIERLLTKYPQLELFPDTPKDSPLSELIDQNGYLRTTPEKHDLDAFFAAKIRKKEEL